MINAYPVDVNGNMASFPHYQTTMEKWKDFTAILTLEGTTRGRSSVNFIWKSEDGRTWPMFISGVTDLMKRGLISEGKTDSRTWTVAKRGANYGIMLRD